MADTEERIDTHSRERIREAAHTAFREAPAADARIEALLDVIFSDGTSHIPFEFVQVQQPALEVPGSDTKTRGYRDK